MLPKSEITKVAEKKHLSQRNAEKDYLLELLLYVTSDQRKDLVFKGGTALYKFYNLNRFSEDLDFDVIGKRFNVSALIATILRHLELTGMGRTLYEKANYKNETNVKFSVRGPYYDGNKNSMSRVTLNLSKRERPLLIQDKFLTTSYPDIPSFELSVLSDTEIAAEKIRCIMTRDKPRDIYDLWFLYKRGTLLDLSLINKKLKLYGLTFTTEIFYKKIQEKRLMWARDLKDLLIGKLPDFDDIVIDLQGWDHHLK